MDTTIVNENYRSVKKFSQFNVMNCGNIQKRPAYKMMHEEV